MKENYKIATTHGTATRTGEPWKVYESKGSFYFHKLPNPGQTVWTAHVQTGPEFIVYPRKENGRIYITEKQTGFSCLPKEYHPQTFREALEIVAKYAGVILGFIGGSAQ